MSPKNPLRAVSESAKANSDINSLALSKRGVRYGFGKTVPVADVEAELFLNGADGQHVSAGRVVGGAILAGPVGAIIGGLAKKGNQFGVLEVRTPEWTRTFRVQGSKVAKAQTFLMNLERMQAADR